MTGVHNLSLLLADVGGTSLTAIRCCEADALGPYGESGEHHHRLPRR